MGKMGTAKAAAEQVNITEDYMNGYMKGKMDAKADSEEVIVELKEEIRQLKRERDELREKYDINYLRAGDIVKTTDGDLAVLTSEDTDGSWNMIYADGKGDNMTSRCFRKTGQHLDLDATPFNTVLQSLHWSEIDTDW